MSKINIYFVRHGQTYLNLYHRIQGIANAPLTKKGIQDAIDAGNRLKSIHFDQAYSSDAPRAITTAKYILAANPSELSKPTVDKAFREENFGYFEGNDDEGLWHMIGSPLGADTYNEMLKKYSMGKIMDMIHDFDPYHHAESNQEILERFMPGFNRVVKNAQDGDNVLVAAHGTIIRWLTQHFDPQMDITEGPKNGSVTKVSVIDGKPKVQYYNRVSDKL
ncbi:phosphoglycerate mutase [Philodulcilactobacillus myokoensis]|uniref:Phosphoglycerate mutase n=1 Tax=Philodulcilactobacillus myokoensis TaxID=2929573 RepID=A0A9W6B112_9LACO|nr:histidine phosphatase family protein [Philodulcilactobacillus myokoensis]GLB46576.1 phosphoglycerate mutase [Philodulcilactobacillus myokoensis]